MNALKIFAELIEVLTEYHLTIGEDSRYTEAKNVREAWYALAEPMNISDEFRRRANRAIMDMLAALEEFE